MPQVKIFSKVMNDIEYRVYEHTQDEKGKNIDSRVIDKVTIQGRNSSFRTTKILSDSGMTMVDKDLWDKIVKDYGVADLMLRSGQIFEAKNDVDAVARIQDTCSNISDPLTKAQVDKKAEKFVNARKLV